MMVKPSLDDLLSRVDSKYTLVVASAKRARGLMAGDEQMVESKSLKPVTIALEEMAGGKLFYERTRTGPK